MLFYQAQGKALGVRYAELVDEIPVESRSSEEIISSIKSKLKKMEG